LPASSINPVNIFAKGLSEREVLKFINASFSVNGGERIYFTP
jgi:hypothetical protein